MQEGVIAKTIPGRERNAKWVCRTCSQTYPCYLLLPAYDKPLFCPATGTTCAWEKALD
jgi:hypothetical protein